MGGIGTRFGFGVAFSNIAWACQLLGATFHASRQDLAEAPRDRRSPVAFRRLRSKNPQPDDGPSNSREPRPPESEDLRLVAC